MDEGLESGHESVVSIAVSGGGHRASAFAIGVLQAVVDAGLGPSTTSITSVSGGSITNAFVANEMDLQSVDRQTFDAKISRLRAVIADDGLFFTGPRTDGYVNRTLLLCCLCVATASGVAAAAIGASITSAWWWLCAGIPPLVAAIALSLKRSRSVPPQAIGPLGTWLVVLALLMATLGVFGALSTSRLSGLEHLGVVLVWVGAVVGICYLAIWQLGRRGKVLVKALDDEFFHGVDLAAIDRPIDHIFATTDLETADSLYLAPRFVASYRRGVAEPAGVTLAEAAQASAALPLGFPPAILTPTEPFQHADDSALAGSIPLSDGGAYDNMGDQWDIRRGNRVAEWEEAGLKPDGLGPDPNLLIVANASGAWMWENWNATSTLGRELTSLARNQGIQYDQSTATRRRVLFDTFSEALRTGAGLRGVLIQIDRSPFQVVDFLPSAEQVGEAAHDGMVDRAKQARSALGAMCQHPGCLHTQADGSCVGRAAWEGVTTRNARVPTTLAPIGPLAYESLTTHARTAVVTYLFVIHDIGDVALIDRPPEE